MYNIILRFNFTLDLNFICLCFKLITTHFHTQKEGNRILTKDKIEPQHIRNNTPGFPVAQFYYFNFMGHSIADC